MNKFIKSYQSIIKENGKGISDLEEYITHELNAIEVKVTEQELYSFMKNVLVNKVIVRPARNREKDVKEYHGQENYGMK